MDILGKVKGGVVLLVDSKALPDGTVVRVEPVEEGKASEAAESVGEPEGLHPCGSAAGQATARALRRAQDAGTEPVEGARAASEGEGATLADRLRGLAGIAKGLPRDLARNHDHYLHGRPKR